MARAYISVGSNIDRERNVKAALDALSAAYGKLHTSSVFESEPVGFEGDPFYNLAVGLDTSQSVGALANVLRKIEDACERRRDTPRFSPRTLDLDLLAYDDERQWYGHLPDPIASAIINKSIDKLIGSVPDEWVETIDFLRIEGLIEHRAHLLVIWIITSSKRRSRNPAFFLVKSEHTQRSFRIDAFTTATTRSHVVGEVGRIKQYAP